MRRLKVGDLVQVISGREKGKTGKVAKILWEQDRVFVEGVNQVVRHQKPNAKNQQGRKITKEASLHVSNVMPVDPTTNKPTRVKAKTGEDGKKTRVGKSGAAITAAS